MSRSSILIPLLVLVILIAVLALVLYYDIRHTYRDGDLGRSLQIITKGYRKYAGRRGSLRI